MYLMQMWVNDSNIRTLPTKELYNSVIQCTVRPLLSADLAYPRFLRTEFSRPNFFAVQSNLHYLHLCYPRLCYQKNHITPL